MIDKNTSCCFTGHREQKLPWRGNENDPRCLDLKEKIYDAAEAAYRAGIRHYICGMATGCDHYFGEAVLALRQEHPEITLEAAIPFEGQAKGWTAQQRKRYLRLAAECDFQTVLQRDYSPDCMARRNHYMVDSSALLIAAFCGNSGGTLKTILYAMRSGLEVIQIDFSPD